MRGMRWLQIQPVLNLFIAVLMFVPISSSGGNLDYEAHIKKYAQCEALQNVVANILSASEAEYLNHELHLAANDSRIVMLEFVRLSGLAPEVADEFYAVYLDEYRKALISEGEEDKLDLFIDNIRPQLQKCKELNEIQADIINRSATY